MDGKTLLVSPNDHHARLGTVATPALVDVRRRDVFSAADKFIMSASNIFWTIWSTGSRRSDQLPA
jgi:hypothetical protein